MAQICTNPGCETAHRNELIRHSAIQFCPNCGNKLQTVADLGIKLAQPAPRGARIGAYLLDFGIAFLITIVAVVPIIGQLISGLVLGAFWLFRDVNGGSPGKSAVGLTVVNRSGSPSTAKQRIMRNLTLSIPALSLIIPILGYEAAGILGTIAFLTETVMLLATGERLGDRLAGTLVVKRSAAAMSAGAS